MVFFRENIEKVAESMIGQIDHTKHQASPDHEVKVCVDLDGDPCLAPLFRAALLKTQHRVFSSYGNAQEKFHLPSLPHHLLRATRRRRDDDTPGEIF